MKVYATEPESRLVQVYGYQYMIPYDQVINHVGECQNACCRYRDQLIRLERHHLRYGRNECVQVLCRVCHRIAEMNKEAARRGYRSNKMLSLRQERDADKQLTFRFKRAS